MLTPPLPKEFLPFNLLILIDDNLIIGWRLPYGPIPELLVAGPHRRSAHVKRPQGEISTQRHRIYRHVLHQRLDLLTAMCDLIVDANHQIVKTLLLLEEELSVLIIDVLLLAKGFLVQLECLLQVLELRLLRPQFQVTWTSSDVLYRCGFGEAHGAARACRSSHLALENRPELLLDLSDFLAEGLGLLLDGLPTRPVLFGPLHPRNFDHLAIVLLYEIAKLDQVILHLLILFEHTVRR